ncbi:MAG TPA: NADP-dependent oxidoreductase [Steroidobacteraceae bacterium]|nr:NADP-dependent oxidoreductase [Steroidobacteraceae bacterium]
MATMKAVRIHSFGGPEVLKIEEVPVPEPRDDEVRIRVHAASVNPVDYKIRSGKYPPVKQDQLPKILGRDVAGTIERCGRAVTDWKEGDAVYALLDSGSGGYAQYTCVKAGLCAPKPRQLDFTFAAAVPLAGITAWQGEFDHGHLERGQRELIHGGAGGVGHLAIQFARSRGASVSTTVAREDLDFVRSLGAELAIDYRAERFEEELRDVDLVLDLVGGEAQERSWAVLKEGGALISTLQQPSESKARERRVRAERYVAQPDAAELRQIGELIDDGKVRPHVLAIYPLQEVAEAHRRLEGGHVRGKIVLELVS